MTWVLDLQKNVQDASQKFSDKYIRPKLRREYWRQPVHIYAVVLILTYVGLFFWVVPTDDVAPVVEPSDPTGEVVPPGALSGDRPFFAQYFLTNRFWLSFYFLTAFAGLRLYALLAIRSFLPVQLLFWYVAGISVFIGPYPYGADGFFASKELNSVFCLISYSLLVGFAFFSLLRHVQSDKRRIWIWSSVVAVLCAGCFWSYWEKSDFFTFSLIILPSAVSAITSLIYILRKHSRPLYHAFYQAAFWGTIIQVFNLSYLSGIVYLTNDLVTNYLVVSWAITAAAILWLAVDRLFITYWRRALVASPDDSSQSKPISIYPDANYYVDVHGKAEWLGKFIHSSDGGVIGLTGLRGAGKSALLNKVVSQFDAPFFTLHITSPVRSGDRMEFFMMVCREVCSAVIKRVEDKIFNVEDTIASTARRGLWRRIRLISLVLTLGVGGYFLYASNLIEVDSASISFTGKNELTVGKLEQMAVSTGIVAADEANTRALLQSIDAFLGRGDSTFDRLLVVPVAGQPLGILPVADANVDLVETHALFFKNYLWLESTLFDSYIDYSPVRKPEAENLWADPLYFNGIYFTQVVLPYLDSYGDFKELVRSIFSAYYSSSSSGLLDWSSSNLFVSFINNQYQNAPSTIEAYFRNNYLDEARIAHYVGSVARMLKVESRFEIPDSLKVESQSEDSDLLNILNQSEYSDSPKLMSWVLLEAFFRHAPDNDKETLLFDREKRLPQLRDLLEAYLREFPSSSDGPTSLSPAAPQTISPLWQSLLSNIYLLIVGGFVLILLLGGFVVRQINLFMAALINFNEYGLLQRSRNFVHQLSYSQSHQQGGQFSLANWLQLSTNRTLTERELTLPDLTKRYIDYIAEASSRFNGKMIICIDELDKIEDPAMVQQILRQIKGALFVKNTVTSQSVGVGGLLTDTLRPWRKGLGVSRLPWK